MWSCQNRSKDQYGTFCAGQILHLCGLFCHRQISAGLEEEEEEEAMASYESYVGGGENLSNARPFDSDGYLGFDPRLQSQRFESFGMPEEGFPEDHFTPEDGKESAGDPDEEDDFGLRKGRTGSNGAFDSIGGGSSPRPPYRSSFDDDLGNMQSPPMSSSTFGESFESRLQAEFPADEFSPSMDANGKGLGHDDSFSQSKGFGYGFPPSPGFHSNGGAILPPPEEMQSEEGFLLREWKQKNAIHLEEKARNEGERLSQIIDAADAYKDSFYEKRRAHCEATKKNNRDKEQVFLENHKDFHANANKHYWKAVAEIIPHELPTMETKSRGKKDQKKPSVVVNHGPKPGKATDLSRMRQVLVKLKHNPPAHMKVPPPAPSAAASAEGGDGKADAKASAEGGGDGKAVAPQPTPAPLQKQGSVPTAPVA